MNTESNSLQHHNGKSMRHAQQTPHCANCDIEILWPPTVAQGRPTAVPDVQRAVPATVIIRSTVRSISRVSSITARPQNRVGNGHGWPVSRVEAEYYTYPLTPNFFEKEC